MDNSLIAYLETLQMLAFFAGYPLVYALVIILPGRNPRPASIWHALPGLLPKAYALASVLFLGYILKTLPPHFSLQMVSQQFYFPWLTAWGILGILFWLPAINKKPVYSLLHSMVFFFLLLQQLYLYMTAAITSEWIKNDMKIYSGSILLHLGTLACVLLAFLIHRRVKAHEQGIVS